MILRCVLLLAATLSLSASGELVETECGFIERTERGLQCEFNNIYTFDTTDVIIIERNMSIDAVSFRQSELYAVPADIFLKFPQLKHLDVELTQLKVVRPENFLNANQLKYFLARFNEIERLEAETFAAAPLLKFIVLQHNRISSIDATAFYGLNNLEALYLDYNQMVSLPHKMLDFVPNLMHFSVAFNNLTATPDSLFSRTPILETINLGRNRLRVFNDKQFDSLPNLERVQLDHNQLQELDLVACKSTEINVDKNELRRIELGKFTRIVSAWDNPVEELVLHEHYGTGRAYNFSFARVNQIVFFVHELCCTVENLENFYILIQSFGDLNSKGFNVNDWSCTFDKTVGYDTSSGFVTNNVCRKVRNLVNVADTTTTLAPTTPQTTTTTRRPLTTRRYIQNIEDTIFSGEVESREQLENIGSARPPLFTSFEIAGMETSGRSRVEASTHEFEADVVESTTEDYEKKAEKGLWKTIKKNASKLKNNVVRKWNDWVG